MSTPGLVTVVSSDNNVIMKIMAGCNGAKVEKVASWVQKNWPISVDDAYKAAKKIGFGCTKCLVVATDFKIKQEAGDEIRSIRRRTFQRPRSHPFHPRLVAGLIKVIEV